MPIRVHFFAPQPADLVAARSPWARCGLLLLAVVLALGGLCLNSQIAQAADAPTANSVSELACYAVADERNLGPDNTNDPGDTLTVLDPATGDTQIIGATNTENIEAISFGPDNVIFAANGWRLGTLDKDTGVFTPRPQGFGTAGGSLGEIGLGDVDGIAFSLDKSTLFGAHRRSDNSPGDENLDLLFAIDATTGRHIPDYFGPGVDYIAVPAVTDDEGRLLPDIDDIQFDPVSGMLYGVMNFGGESGVLVSIGVTPGVDTVIVTRIGTFRDASDNDIIDDIEGISFANDGTLFVSTGDNFTGDRDDLNSLYRVDAMTALGELVGPFPVGPKDYEALACLSAEAAIVLRKSTNGPGQSPDDADTPTGPNIQVGDTVTWTYTFTNTGVLTLTNFSLVDDKVGAVGPSNSCVPAGTTLAPGFSVTCTMTGIAVAGQYSNTATVTADSLPTPLFPSFTVSDTNPSHYFGIQSSPTPTPTPPTPTPTPPTPTPTPPTPTPTPPTPTPTPPTPTPTPPTPTPTPPTETATLGDRVWQDVDDDGLQEAGEPGLGGVTVTLLTDSCTVPTGQSTVTGENGLYLFSDLAPGDYCVQFTLPTGYTFTTPNAGDDANDSDANPADGKSPTVTLAAGETNLTVDAGLVVVSSEVLATVGDTVWFDENLNGIQDGIGTEGGEQGVSNVQVNLIAVESVDTASVATTAATSGPTAIALTATLTTDANGRYLFSELPPGDYYVQFIGPAEYGFTTPDANGNSQDAADSDAQVPLIAIELADDVEEVEPGQIVTYSINYTNTHATLTANGAVLSTTVPAGTSFVAAASSPAWQCAADTPGSVCSLELDAVAPGATGSVAFAVRLQTLDEGPLPPAVFILVRLIQSRQANTPIITLEGGEENLTLDAGLVPIQNSGDIEADEQTPTTTEPTNLPPTEQPDQDNSLFLPSLRQGE